MKKNKTLSIDIDTAGVALAVAMAFAGWYVGIVGVLIFWAVTRAVLKPSGGGGIVGVEQQSQARGKRPRTGNGGVGHQTFFGTGRF